MPTQLSALDKSAPAYTVTADDVLWLRRAVEAEGEPRRDVARALVNLFVLTRAKNPRRTLTDLIRAYAQPVNPRWFTNGDLFLRAVKQAEPGKRDAMAVAARRREAVHSTRVTFAEETDRAVMEALGGLHAVDVTDYAAPWVDGAAKGYERRSEKPVPGTPTWARNALWTRRPGWGGYAAESVTTGRQDGFVTEGAAVLVLAAAAALFAAWVRS